MASILLRDQWFTDCEHQTSIRAPLVTHYEPGNISNILRNASHNIWWTYKLWKQRVHRTPNIHVSWLFWNLRCWLGKHTCIGITDSIFHVIKIFIKLFVRYVDSVCHIEGRNSSNSFWETKILALHVMYVVSEHILYYKMVFSTYTRCKYYLI